MTPPLAALLAGLRLALGTGNATADARAIPEVGDWDAVARLARYHRVTPLLLEGLGADAVRLAGEEVEARLRRGRDRARVRALGQIVALEHATRALEEHGVPCIVLKGLPLSCRLHGHALAREAIDIDVLVPPEAFDGAERVLCERGWRRIEPDFQLTPVRKRWHDTLIKDHTLTRRARTGAGPEPILELHRRLLNNPRLMDVPFARLHERALEVEVGGCTYRTLGDDDLLPYLVCHGLEHCWHRVKWLCDVAALVASMSAAELARAVARCRAEGLGCALAPALGLCALALHVAVPPAAAPPGSGGLRTAMVMRVAHRAWNGDPTGAWARIARDAQMQALRLVAKSHARFTLHELARLVLAPHDFGRVDLPDALFFLYPVVRPFVWLGKRLRPRWPQRTGRFRDEGTSGS